MTENTEKLSLMVTEDTMDWLKLTAKNSDLTVSQLVRGILRERKASDADT